MKLSLILFGFTFTLASISCTKEVYKCDFEGNIIDYDAEKCKCCPGFLLTHGTDTLKSHNLTEHPDVWSTVRSLGFPVPVRFSYEDSQGDCPNYITLTCLFFDYKQDCGQDGEIIDYFSAECVCCPGWLIRVDNDTIKIETLPEESKIRNIANNNGYPIKIKLDYEDLDDYCYGLYKKLNCFKLID
jgi:hypothetical protein